MNNIEVVFMFYEGQTFDQFKNIKEKHFKNLLNCGFQETFFYEYLLKYGLDESEKKFSELYKVGEIK